MKKIVISLATLGAVAAVAAPAAAQSYRQNDGWNLNQRQTQIERRIDQGVRHGDLNRREANRLRNDFYQIARLEARYRVNGLSSWERNDLDRRLDRLEAQVRFERRDYQYSRR